MNKKLYTIKPLKWEYNENISMHRGYNNHGNLKYEIEHKFPVSFEAFELNVHREWYRNCIGSFTTLDKAKDACQARYERDMAELLDEQ